MATVKQIVGARTSLLALSTLATGTYITSSAYNCTTNQPLDVIIEVSGSAASVPGNKQLVVFVIDSLDGTNYRSGPTSGTTTTDEPNLRFLGTVPINSTSTVEAGTFSIVQALGYVPPYFKIVVKNDVGAILIAGGMVYTSEISNTVV